MYIIACTEQLTCKEKICFKNTLEECLESHKIIPVDFSELMTNF